MDAVQVQMQKDLSDTTNNSNSAQIRKSPKLMSLRKRNYQSNEKITFVIENGQRSDLKFELEDSNKQKLTSTQFEEISDEGPVIMKLNPSNAFRPGKYTLKVIDSNSGSVQNQDFNWGVLAINFDKSIYNINDRAQIAIAVLDEKGDMVCNADVELKIGNVDTGFSQVIIN